jgi:D-alanyl-D-alanine carboxypeptidase/D-alanyl-D-alanine-endopeptidase (penicillin-binding protein 4)
MSKRADFDDFRNTIPLGGRTGSISRKFRGTPAEGRIWAKSGTLSRVRSYAGYARTVNGTQYCFAIFVNNYSNSGGLLRQKLDQFLIDLCR